MSAAKGKVPISPMRVDVESILVGSEGFLWLEGPGGIVSLGLGLCKARARVLPEL